MISIDNCSTNYSLTTAPTCRPEEARRWHLTWVTMVVIILALCIITALGAWLVARVSTKSYPGRVNKARDLALICLLLPLLAVHWAFMSLWDLGSAKLKTFSESGVDSGPEAGRPKPWDLSSKEAVAAAQVTASAVVILALVVLVGSIPNLPTVDACIEGGGVQTCHYGPFDVFEVGGKHFYFNTSQMFGVDLESGSRASVFHATSISGFTVCGGNSVPHPGKSLILSNYHTETSNGHVDGEACFGAGLGLAFGGFVSVVASFVTVYCPAQTVDLTARAMETRTYIDWTQAVRVAQVEMVRAVVWYLCEASSPRVCHEFPTSEGYLPLYITSTGSVQTYATGAIAEVTVPTSSQVSSTYTTSYCTGGTCRAAGAFQGNCPAVMQPNDVRTADIVSGGPAFNDSNIAVPVASWDPALSDYLQASSEACVAEPANFNGETQLLSGLAYIGITANPQQQAECEDDSHLRFVGCYEGGDDGPADQSKPIPGLPGYIAVYQCPTVAGSRGRVVLGGATAPPIPNGPPQDWRNCSAVMYGLMQCSECDTYRVCHPTGVAPPGVVATGGAAMIANGTYIFGPTAQAAGVCDLRVLKATDTSIMLGATNYPCLTAGEMGVYTLTSPRVVQANVRGWLHQQTANGTLAWRFFGRFIPQSSVRLNESVLVYHYNGTGADCSNCRCDSDCGSDIVCSWILQAGSFSSCRCAVLSQFSDATLGCTAVQILLRIIAYVVAPALILALAWVMLKAAVKAACRSETD